MALGPRPQSPASVRIRDAIARGLPAIVGIHNPTVPTRVFTADTESVSVEDRRAWFRGHEPSRRPIPVAEDAGKGVGRLGAGDVYNGRPAYHAPAKLGVCVHKDHRPRGAGLGLVEEAVGTAGSA